MQMQLNTAITSGEASSLIGFGDVVTATANAGGAASGFGSTTFGLGALFGANPWCRLANGATYFNQCVGAELDGSIQTGASSSVFAVQQNVLTSDHATHGAVTDVMLSFEAQGGAGVGVRNLITAGRFDSGGQGGTSYSSPLDPNGYLFQVQPGATSVPADTVIIGAGGFDLNLFSATGIGATGGGFAWRSPGVQLLPAAAQIGNLGITAGTSGPVLTANYQEMVGTPSTITVATGGTDWNPNQLACDNYGDCVRVTESSGVVTAVAAVVSQGWQTAPPSNPVAFTGQTAPGTSLGTGLTLNLTWASAKTISFGTAGGASNGFEFVPSASGSIPRIAGVGVDASQAFQLEAAGTGGLQLGNTGKGISVAIGNAGGVPGGVDYLALLGSAGAGTDVAVISADGGDANVSLELRTQGAGTVDLMPGSSVTVFSASASVVSVVGAHIASTGTAPAVSGCGTSPSIASGSTDLKGIINVGSGTVTACTVTFATAYASTPVVVVEVNGTTAVASSVSGASTTGFTANFASSVGGGFIGYHVIQ